MYHLVTPAIVKTATPFFCYASQVEPGGLWYCWMHPDLQRRGCHAPAETDKSQDACDACVGYCGAVAAMGSGDNTAHYRCGRASCIWGILGGGGTYFTQKDVNLLAACVDGE
jgi:hypothetical protein